MAFLLNILWFILGGGFAAGLLWLVTGLILMVTVVGIPFGFAAFRIAGFAAFPFGKELVDARAVGEERIAGTGLANILWIVLAGIWLALSHILAGISLCLTIIGIPFGFCPLQAGRGLFFSSGKAVRIEIDKQAGRKGVLPEGSDGGPSGSSRRLHRSLRVENVDFFEIVSQILPFVGTQDPQ